MPTALYVRRFEGNQSRPEVAYSYISSYIWMDYIMEIHSYSSYKMNNSNKEVRIGPYLVDGFCIEILQFMSSMVVCFTSVHIVIFLLVRKLKMMNGLKTE